MQDYIIKDASDDGVPCFQVHDAATDEMVAWCVSMNDAMDYVRFLLSDRYLARRETRGSIECPHCHWGFDSSTIAQHIREKH